jgi:cobalt-zinc-cadmium efflux system outer membrane protein
MSQSIHKYAHVRAAVLLLALVATPHAAGQTTTVADVAGMWTLADCRQEALKRNPDLRVASARLEAARALMQQAGRWANPGLEGRTVGNERELVLSQEIDLWGQRSTAARLGEAETKAADEQARMLERELMESVTRHYWRLAQSQKLLELGQVELEVWTRLLEIREREVELGASPPADFLTLKQDAAQRTQAIRQLRFESDSARAALNTILARHPGEPIMVADAPPDAIEVYVDRLLDAALLADPSAGKARANLVAAGYRIEQERRLWRPTPELGLAVKEEDGNWDAGVQVAFSLPVWDRNRGGIKAAAEGQEQALAEVESAELRAAQAAYQTFLQHEAASAASAHYESQVLPIAQDQLSKARKGLATGDVSEREFLIMQLEWLRRQQEAAILRYRRAESTSLIEMILPAPATGHDITNR